MALKRIETSAVRRICSGQVITDLQTAVKELVENSLDAGATVIDVRLRNCGVDGFDVMDNGSGICEQDYITLAKRYHTSKLSQFNDLESLASFGFRGEALASLCSVARLSVTTCTWEQEPIGVHLEYNSAGDIHSRRSVAATRGTIVTVTNLMDNYPVRRAEFVKNAKRDCARCVQLVQAYAMITQGVRFSCCNQIKKGERVNLFCTNGNNTVRGNLIDLLGSKMVKNLEDVHLVLDDLGVCTITGLVSKPDVGCGRGAADKQYYFINKRPCDLPKVARIINDSYRTYNPRQYPFTVFNFTLPPDAYDVNVTPDKRTIFLHNESILLNALQTKLRDLWETSRSTFHLADVSGTTNQINLMWSTPSSSQISSRIYTPSSQGNDSLNTPTTDINEITEPSVNYVLTEEQPCNIEQISSSSILYKTSRSRPRTPSLDAQQQKIEFDKFSRQHKRIKVVDVTKNEAKTIISLQTFESKSSRVDIQKNKLKKYLLPIDDEHPQQHNPNTLDQFFVNQEPDVVITETDTPLDVDDRPTITLSFSSQRACQLRLNSYPFIRHLSDDITSLSSNTVIGVNDITSVEAKEELPRIINKSDFLTMRIIGQFNLGFIITQLKKETGANDLLIIDQHASDEKYNFEMLQRNDTVQTQRLIAPKSLHLSPSDEIAAMEHEPLLRKNGFNICYDAEKPAGQRVLLNGLPQVRGVQFSHQDLEELLSLAALAPFDQSVRPTRLRAIYASKACRKSAMIGMPLDKKAMTRIVRNLNTIDKPWSCPHSRPTMRILYSMAGLEQRVAAYTIYKCTWTGTLFRRK